MKNFNDIDNNDKEKLKYYAEKAKEAINLNINYHKQKEIYENYIREIKSILFVKYVKLDSIIIWSIFILKLMIIIKLISLILSII